MTVPKLAPPVARLAIGHVSGPLTRRPDHAGESTLGAVVADAVASGRMIESPNALKRQMKLIRKELGDADYEAIEVQVEAVQNPGRQAPKAPKVDLAFELYAKLSAAGDEGLFAFCSEHPELDSTQMRGLVRAADKQRKESPDSPPGKLAAVRKVVDKLRRYAVE